MTSFLSLSKAARAAYKYKPSAASISTNAAQDFRNHFWEAAAARSLKRNGSTNDEAVPSAPSSRVIENTSHRQEDDKAGKLRKCAREDLFKHFRMSAASRAMKRGNGVMSNYFSINEEVQSIHHCEGSTTLHTELPSMIDVATARKAREDMYHHFWSSHRAREDARNETKTRLTMSARLPTSTSVHEAVLVNCRSAGRKFKNHVRVGHIKNETGDTTHSVGLFTKLSDDDLSNASHEDLYPNV